MPSNSTVQPDVQELILCPKEDAACETYLFEPASGEEKLGWLFVAVQTPERGGIGSELLDTVVTAIQREYYRDPNRTPSTSFEMALHQANLILHDMAEQGIREWMTNFHAIIGALASTELHVSVAGEAQALLVRKNTATDISVGLAHMPITNPLQTFSQVATGPVSTRDVLLLSTTPLTSFFSEAELARISLEQTADQITSRLQGRYTDTNQSSPVAAVVVTLLPQYVSRAAVGLPARASRAVNPRNLLPRQPLFVRRSTWQRLFFMAGEGIKASGAFIKAHLWPLLKRGSHQGGRAVVAASREASRTVRDFTSNHPPKLPNMKEIPRTVGQRATLTVVNLRQRYTLLPKSSKIFAILSLVLVVALAGSILLLQHKRAADAEIQQASEDLHEAQTKLEAAKTALIYDNRDQAQGLLLEAKQTADTLVGRTLYVEEAQALLADIEQQFDRLQRIVRPASESTRTVGDFSQLVSEPKRLFRIGDNFYTYNPENNAVISMGADGVTSTVHETTQGIGFLADGAVHEADRTITLTTDPAGIAIFDAKDNSLANQSIEFSSSKPTIADIGVFGNRLYVLDTSTNNIFVYNKTLRGYSTGSPWITDSNFPSTTITAFGIDGNIFTLHQDGSIRRLFKGQTADFTAEVVEPAIPSTARLIVAEELQNLYVVDPAGKRVIIFDKNGALQRQVLVDFANQFADATVSVDEDRLYVLDGTRVLEVSLAE